jgi:hypothetical protein
MNQSPPEQSLEWTYQHRFPGMEMVQCFFFSAVLTLLCFLFPILSPFSPTAPFSPMGVVVCFIFVGVFSIILLVWLTVTGKMPSRTLRINQHTITLTDTTAAFGAKERQMNTAGARVQAIYVNFLDRFFTFSAYRSCSTYHIEIIGSRVTFLFPCADENQQQQIIKEIEQLINPDREHHD